MTDVKIRARAALDRAKARGFYGPIPDLVISDLIARVEELEAIVEAVGDIADSYRVIEDRQILDVINPRDDGRSDA